jgi:hypothetical protein
MTIKIQKLAMGACSSSKKNPDNLIALFHEISCENKQKSTKHKCAIGFELLKSSDVKYFDSDVVYVIIDGRTLQIFLDKCEDILKNTNITRIVTYETIKSYLVQIDVKYVYSANIPTENVEQLNTVYEYDSKIDESDNADVNKAKLYFE